MQPVWLAKAKRTHPSAFLIDLGLAQLTERRYDISDDAVLEKLVFLGSFLTLQLLHVEIIYKQEINNPKC